ncbi:NAD(P)-binding protein [Glonium stellatum]|uniref:NAD(P)-binding protein n=1 Tax=Glonium stellatum TaxID=574774 RepID=A0A8E2JSM4_9PEZI|nr:NAD(P)-binding protein [Glonium stellatum]
MEAPKVLITGVTGFIGGTILTTLQNTSYPSLKNAKISVLVRGESRAAFFREKGIETEVIEGVDQVDLLRKIASNYDIIINPAFCFQTDAANALVLGMGDRVKETGKELHFIQTSGTSNLGDRPITGKHYEDRIFSDNDDIFGYEVGRNENEPYPQRTTELVITKTGAEVGVKTHIIMSPTIYGVGTGFFNKMSIQIPILIRIALDSGKAEYIGDGKGEWDYVHILDLATLYEIMLAKIVQGEDIPYGNKGIFFSETGNYKWKELAQGIADAGNALGALKTNETKSITMEEARKLNPTTPEYIELGFASNSRTRAYKARELGWKPVKTEKDWQAGFREDFKNVLRER